MARLENWSIDKNCCGDAGDAWVYGNIYDDEQRRFEDGCSIKTSKIIALNLGDKYVQTRNTKYELGKISEVFLNTLISEYIK